MDETQLMLDGNAMAGMLGELFVDEITTVRCACNSCGLVEPVGAQHVYMSTQSPGGVVRCRGCESTLMVLVRREGHVRLGMPGAVWLEFTPPQ